MAFEGDLKDRQTLAWMFFIRVSQMIADPARGGVAGTGVVPVWMAWATDNDTFSNGDNFVFDMVPRTDMAPSAEKSDLLAGRVSLVDPDAANEEVTRNEIGHRYLLDTGLTTKAGVAAFFANGENSGVDMPIGSIELKASWLQITDGSPAPDGALTFDFESGPYWLRGLHIMPKMRHLDDPGDAFYSDDPSWFWTTFEFNENVGADHIRNTFITERFPLKAEDIADLLAAGGLSEFGLENYAPNGTQIGFIVDGKGDVPSILGHTDMEDFAGFPNTAQPRYWTGFQASCHSCHATASYNPQTDKFFPFSVPTGELDPGYNDNPSGSGVPGYLGQGYLPLDFMWPIAFRTK